MREKLTSLLEESRSPRRIYYAFFLLKEPESYLSRANEQKTDFLGVHPWRRVAESSLICLDYLSWSTHEYWEPAKHCALVSLESKTLHCEEVMTQEKAQVKATYLKCDGQLNL